MVPEGLGCPPVLIAFLDRKEKKSPWDVGQAFTFTFTFTFAFTFTFQVLGRETERITAKTIIPMDTPGGVFVGVPSSSATVAARVGVN